VGPDEVQDSLLGTLLRGNFRVFGDEVCPEIAKALGQVVDLGDEALEGGGLREFAVEKGADLGTGDGGLAEREPQTSRGQEGRDEAGDGGSDPARPSH
jgi:hypothetical protein